MVLAIGRGILRELDGIGTVHVVNCTDLGAVRCDHIHVGHHRSGIAAFGNAVIARSWNMASVALTTQSTGWRST